MSRFVIEFDRERCIGAGACEAACPKFWRLTGEKAELLGGTPEKDNAIQTCEIDNVDLKCNIDAARTCPVNAIHIINKETREKIV